MSALYSRALANTLIRIFTTIYKSLKFIPFLFFSPQISLTQSSHNFIGFFPLLFTHWLFLHIEQKSLSHLFSLSFQSFFCTGDSPFCSVHLFQCSFILVGFICSCPTTHSCWVHHSHCTQFVFIFLLHCSTTQYCHLALSLSLKLSLKLSFYDPVIP